MNGPKCIHKRALIKHEGEWETPASNEQELYHSTFKKVEPGQVEAQ